MSFAQIHNDYLDPDCHLWPEEDYGFEEILAALKKHDTGRWQWCGIDAAWTGKYGDLSRYGQQGCKLDSVDEENATVTVHAVKLFAGYDVCINLPDKATDEQAEECVKIFMEQAQLVVDGCASDGEWDGDSWIMTSTEVIKVPVESTADEKIDAVQTARVIIAKAEASLAGWEKEIGLADDMMTVLAGWKQVRKMDIDCPPGKPGPGSVWELYKNKTKNYGKINYVNGRP